MKITFDTSRLGIFANGALLGQVYSGHGDGLNNWHMENVPDIGPIPKGLYAVSDAFDSPLKGPTVFRLTPIGHDAHGRTAFEMHGDNKFLNHTASNGCIIAARPIREWCDKQNVTELEVV